MMGEKIGRKKRKKKGRKKKGKKRKKKGEVNKTIGKKGRRKGGKDRMKNKKVKERKRVEIKYLNKRKYCVGTEPSALLYIGIVVTSTITGHGGSFISLVMVAQWLVHLLHKQKVGVQFLVVARAFFLQVFSNLCRASNLTSICHAHLINVL